MKKIIGICILTLLGLAGIAQTRTTIHKIAFGSCGNQDEKQPILDLVTRYNPEFLFFLATIYTGIHAI
jgi:hypothetical protein